jgi:glycine dehydrogenase
MKTDSFALRHLGPRDHDLPKMLETIGVETLDQLINETIPSDIRLKKPLDWSIL